MLTSLILGLSCITASVQASPILWASEVGDAPDGSILELAPDGIEHTIEIWLSSQETVLEYFVSLAVGAGIELLAFMPNPDYTAPGNVKFVPGVGGSIAVIGGDVDTGLPGLVAIGVVSLRSLIAGSDMRVTPLEEAAPPQWVNERFDYALIDTPQVLATVTPEPGTGLLLGLGLIALATTKPAPRTTC